MKKQTISGVLSVAAIGFLVSGCGNTSNSGNGNTSGQSSGKQSLTLSWWGSQPRVTSTEAATKLFETVNPNISVQPTFAAWAGYWQKLATQVAGGTAPDVMQMDEGYIVEYANKGTLAPLDSSGVQLDGLDQNALNLGKVNGKLYGIPTGVNAWALMDDPKMLKDAGVTIDPNKNMTWSQLADLAAEIHKKNPNVYGMQDEIGISPTFEYYLRDRGQQLFSADGKSFGFTKQTMINWFNYWKQLEASGAVPPVQFTASYDYTDPSQNPINKGKVAITYMWSNQFATVEQNANRPLSMDLLPDYDSQSKPYFLHPSMYWSISSKTQNMAGAVKLLNYLENNQGVAKTFGNDRGVSINAQNKQAVYQSASDLDKAQISFIDKVQKVASPDNVYPPVAGELGNLLQTVAQEVMFNKLSPAAATDQFFTQAAPDFAKQ